ncbi:DUF374 domain-containing protein [Desulfovibrio sp. OttesenSCG-928-A18]|nr:DUF374 domain-containing protein [Desulfovibrio sp. OttesenSCG-928-A18]
MKQLFSRFTSFLRNWLAGPLTNCLYRLWCLTLRITEEGRERVDALEAQGRLMVFCLWHDELFPLMHVRRSLRIVTVVSRYRDAEYLARLLQSMGLITARGSSSRGGAAALRSALHIMRDKNYNGCITVDGPRGPRHVVKPGAILLAAQTGASIVPVRLFMKRAKVFSSWDRFQLPLPFSRVRIVFAPPYTPQKTLHKDVVREECLRLEAVLDSIAPPDKIEDRAERAGGRQAEGAKGSAAPAAGFQAAASEAGAADTKAVPAAMGAAGGSAADADKNGLAAKRGDSPFFFRRFKAACYKLLALALGACSRTWLYRLADLSAFFFWHCVAKRRKESIGAIAKHLRLPPDRARLLARRSFRENMRSFLEMFHAGRFSTFRDVRVFYSPETVRLLQEETAPIVIATAHLGSWELMPGLSTDLVPEREGMVVVRRQKDPELNRLIASMRGARGMRVIDHRQASAVVLPGLRAGGVAAFLVDHNSNRKEAVFLPFLEDTAAVNVGPAILALRAKATVFPVFLIRDDKPAMEPAAEGAVMSARGSHILYILPPLRTAELRGSIEERTRAVAVFYTQAVERMVRAHPEQWLWMHQRWKTRERGSARQ